MIVSCCRVIKEFLEKQEIIFDMCIDQLKPDLKEQYKTLAIFNEDVNITRLVRYIEKCLFDCPTDQRVSFLKSLLLYD